MTTNPRPFAPASARIPTLDRRTLFRSGLLGAGLASMPAAVTAKTLSGFGYGVASGEPSADSVLLWTRFQAAQDTELQWEIARDPTFAEVVDGGKVIASAERDWSVKPVANGLAANSWYFFRFIAPDGQMSVVGRTRTLPQGPAARFRFAVVGCSNIGFGWFNAYAHIAKADDTDLVLHTGDYVYEYGRGIYPTEEQKLPGRMIGIDEETIALADYRARYAQYRSDPDLQRLHQLFPMLHVPDDHESANDSYAAGAQNHQPENEGPWAARKAAAVRANREWMPVSDEPWAAYEIGDLATLFRLETRLEARTKPFDLRAVIERGDKDPGKILAALRAFESDDWRDPARTLMGEVQEGWLADGLKASRKAGKTWQVLLQQTLMTSLKSSPRLAEGMTDSLPEFVRNRIMGGVLTAMAGLPFNMDAWDGYPAARERLLTSAQEADANLIVLAGDSHNGWASELSNAGAAAGVEFAGHSVSSPGMEGFISWIKPEDMAAQSVQANDQLKWANIKNRGYMSVELTPTKATSEYRFLETVRAKSTALAGTQRISSDAGSQKLDIG